MRVGYNEMVETIFRRKTDICRVQETRFIASYESNLTMLCGYPLHTGVKGSVKGSFHDRLQQKLEKVYW